MRNRSPEENLEAHQYLRGRFLKSAPLFIAAAFTVARRGKQNVGYTYNGIIFHLKKKGNFVTFYNLDEP